MIHRKQKKLKSTEEFKNTEEIKKLKRN